MEKKNVEFTLEEVRCIYHLISAAYATEDFQPTEKSEKVFEKVTNVLVEMLTEPENRIKQGAVVSVNTDSKYLDNQVAGKKGVITYLRIVGPSVLCTVVFENGRALEVNAVSLQLEKAVQAETIIKAATGCICRSFQADGIK